MGDRGGIPLQVESCMTCTERHVGWFCNFPLEALADYNSLGMPIMVPAGATLFREGQAAQSVSILCSGRVKLTTSSKEGKTLLVRVARAGDVLGLSAAMAGTAYETTAEAMEPLHVKTFAREDFLLFMERHIEGSMHAAHMLNREYRAALSDAMRLALSVSIAGRVARLFLELMMGQGEVRPRFTLTLSHEDLANMLGTTRESVTRALSEFKRKEIIAVSGTAITVLRKDALELLTY